MISPRDQILDGSEVAGKFFDFNRQNQNIPAQWWFQKDREGLVLFIVFYTQACRWNRCTGCNLPTMSSLKEINYRHIMRQIDHIFDLQEVLDNTREIHKVIVSNNGSVLDEKTFPSTALMYLLTMINRRLPYMNSLSLETRVEYVDLGELDFISRALGERPTQATLELAVGFEAFDDEIRNKHFNKGLNLRNFEELLEYSNEHGFTVKTYFMLKPVPELSDRGAVKDIHAAIDYLHDMSIKYGIPINIHLNPTFVARGTPLAVQFEAGEYKPPRLKDVAKAALFAKGKKPDIFIGLFDEGLAVEGGSFIQEGEEEIVEILQRFNETQDYSLLETITKEEG